MLTELEFVFALILDSVHFPFGVQNGTAMVLRNYMYMFQKPFLAMLLRPLQKSISLLHQLFPQLPLRLNPKSDFDIGICKEFRGIKLRLSDGKYNSIQQCVSQFTSTRPVRRASDLARPI